MNNSSNTCPNQNTTDTNVVKRFFANKWNVVGVVLCVILLPILVLNCVLIVKGMIAPDKVPTIGNYAPLIVLTKSMEPQIKSGDLIICKQTPISDIKQGDVISFFDPEGNGTSVVTHQIVKVEVDDNGNVSYRTKGVNNNIEDRLSVPSANVIGVYTGVRFAGVGSVVMFAQSPVGLLVLVCVPVALFVLWGVLARRKENRQAQLQTQQTAEANVAAQAEIDALRAELAALKESTNTPTDDNDNPTNQG